MTELAQTLLDHNRKIAVKNCETYVYNSYYKNAVGELFPADDCVEIREEVGVPCGLAAVATHAFAKDSISTQTTPSTSATTSEKGQYAT